MTFKGCRVRFAPSPTGFLHIGGARTALFNWLLARQNSGTFVLRIEDTDRERSTDESTNAILDGMRWLGLDWDEGPDKPGSHGPYLQSERLNIHKQQAEKLLSENKAYRCFCSKENLDKKREQAHADKKNYSYDRTCAELSAQEIQSRLNTNTPFSIRLRCDTNKDLQFNDLIRGPIQFNDHPVDDFIIVRTDGSPVYNFAVAIDDALMKITHVLRGDGHISNTPRQIMVYRALELKEPLFGHMPTILGPDGTKLSKRHGATSVQQFREEGYLSQALINFMARLGWSYDDSQEIFSVQELIEKFSTEKISRNPAIFDTKKLDWLNAEYIKTLPVEKKRELCLPSLIRAGLLTAEQAEEKREYLDQIISLVGDRLKNPGQMTELADYFFQAPSDYEEKGWKKFITPGHTGPFLESVLNKIEGSSMSTKEELDKMFMTLIEEQNLSTGKAMQTVRICLTGRTISPDLSGTILLLGLPETAKRIRTLLKKRQGENLA